MVYDVSLVLLNLYINKKCNEEYFSAMQTNFGMRVHHHAP